MLKPNNVVNERRLKFALTVKIFRCSFPFYIQRCICYTDYKTVRPSDWLKTVIKAQSANLIKMSAIIIYIFPFVIIKTVGELIII